MLFYYWLVLVQIVAESFPISSSTHVMLVEQLFSLTEYTRNAPDIRSYELLMHGAHGVAALIIALFFYPQWSWLLRNWRRCWRIICKIMVLTFCADCITALAYIVIHDKQFALWWYGLGLFLTTLALASVRWCNNRHGHWTVAKAIGLGFVQGCALLPGISRLASTYAAARWMKLPAHKAFQISFLIQWPLITAACARGMVHIAFCSDNPFIITVPMLGGMVAASIIAWYSLRFVAWTAYTKRIWWFSVYMLIPLSVWAWLMCH